MKGRALTDGHKRAIVERIYAAWTATTASHLRLGQLIDNATHEAAAADVFNIEDESLAEAVELFAQAHAKR
jgi:hypothetical protein